MQIVNEHNENVEWYKNNTDAIDAAGDKAREAAASAAAAAESANTAGEKASQASQSASAAASSQSAASASATAAKKSETNAAASQQSAATSASTATTKASEAATSARDAAASKEAAKSSETNASLSASSAASSATAAGNSAKAAKTSETNARSSETAAGQSASAAAGSKTAAASSASAASTSAGQASASATAAGKSAESAASSASTATTKAGEATEQASAAARSASAAKTSETNAKASETSAESSKTAAASSASSAASSASSASASKDEATRQASAAKGSATTASTKATEAAGSATAASQSKTAAESAATRAEAAADRAEEIAGAVAMEDASLTTKGVVKLSSAVDSTSESLAATPKAVKTVKDSSVQKTGDTMGGQLKISTINALRIFNQAFGLIFRRSEEYLHLIPTNEGEGENGNIGPLRPFSINLRTGLVSIGNGVKVGGGITGDLTGNADTATKIKTARKIGGVAFDGSADINLPGVNATGNQNTTGNAATATKLQTARTIGGVSFDGTANINLPGVNTTGNQNTTGNAATATKLQTARTINGVSFDGSANISLSPTNIGCPASPTGWLTTGSNGGAITTAQLVTLLQNNGAFNAKAWIARCAWAYANSASIPDSETGCGIIPLAGAVIEVFNNGSSSNNYTIRITTATTTSVSGALTNAEFIYVFNGTSYSPGWRRAYNTKNKPTAADVGALPLSGGALTGGLTSSGEIISKSANGLRIAYGNYGFFIRNDGSNTYFMLTASGDTLGSWNGLRPITINNTSGAVSIGNGLNVTGGVNGSLNGNASTATKLQTARKISGVSFDGSADITLTAANVSAFARRATGTYADTSGAVPWNAESGAYNVTRSGDSYIVANFYTGVGSCRTLQIRAHYKNGGLYYRSSRDGYGFEEDWTQIYTKKDSIPGVNADGNQNTTGNAATATKLQTARKIAGVAFDGSADITLTAANLNAYTKTEVTNLLSSYVKSSALPSMTVRTSSVSGGDMGMSLSAFISHLKSNGAFSKSYWIGFGDAMGFNAGSINNITGFGAVELAESIIEVFNLPNGDYTIRLTTSHKADYGGVTNAILVYHYRSNRSPSGQWLKFAGTVGATSN
ncbi:TPA: hypothetical protein ACURK9_002481 [Escherichia coli]